ncbi:transglutaminase-like protein [Ceratobasidium sp. AG-Ba]|nr:transglutaminase-like protein [Ceratobasidium sp. AG-Ba]QRW04381.1 transglutaminase-like protein [Ceratobasidium sp. AG-Ba]
MYEDPKLLDLARNEIPIERLKAEATKLQQSDSPLPCEEDALAQVLVEWFKKEYFKWADPIKCPKCSGKTQMTAMVRPTDYELAGGAGRVELHVCAKENGPCDGSYRFPRFNDPAYLMKSRIGRCGEWANLYTLFLRTVGLRARYVWNAEDHVWNEYFSPAAGRWLHTDSCEAARDQPLLYDRGWGKKMSYVIAFSVDGAADVSRGYVQDSAEMFKRRNQAPEDAFAQVGRSGTWSFIARLPTQRCAYKQELVKITNARRRNLSHAKKAQLEAEDKLERAWLAASDERAREPEQPKDEPARISGTKEWKEARGEAGTAPSESGQPGAGEPRASTEPGTSSEPGESGATPNSSRSGEDSESGKVDSAQSGTGLAGSTSSSDQASKPSCEFIPSPSPPRISHTV